MTGRPTETDFERSRESSDDFLWLVLDIESAIKEGREPDLDPTSVVGLSIEEQDRLKRVRRCLTLLRTVTLRNRSETQGRGAVGDAGAPQNDPVEQAGHPSRPILADPEPEPATSLGRFEIVRTIGAGAHGVVFLAHDPVLERDIALKIPRPEVLIADSMRQRFVAECQAAAGLAHPNIVTVYEAGEIGPICYMAQSYVSGPTLGAWLKEQRPLPPPRIAAEIVFELANAIQYAHAHGVLHRDLKPSNVLLEPKPRLQPKTGTSAQAPAGPRPSAGCGFNYVAKVTDFGVAKLLYSESSETVTNAIIGTVSYMSPEQASGENALVSSAADVYGLGAILYELLTGEIVFQGKSTVETLRLVVETEPVSPRTRQPEIPRDLEAICLKCLAKKPSHRYGTAKDLADDLANFLGGLPTAARPIKRSERLIRWCRRKPAAAGLVGVSVAAVAALTASGWYSSNRMKELFLDANEQRHRAEFNEQLANQRELAAKTRAYAADMRLVSETWEHSSGAAIAAILRPYIPAAGTPDLRSFEWWQYYKLLNYDAPSIELGRHEGGVKSVAIDPTGRLAASGGADGIIRLWDMASGTAAAEFRGHKPEAINAVAFSPDGTRLASASDDHTVRVWDIVRRQEVCCLRGHSDWVSSVLFLPDGHRLVSGAADKAIIVWDSANGREIRRLRGHTDIVRALAFVPAIGVLISASEDGTVRAWDVEKGTPCTLVPNGVIKNPSAKWIRTLAVEPDQTTIKGLPFNDRPIRWDIRRESFGNVMSRPGPNGNARSVSIQGDPKCATAAYGLEESYVHVRRPDSGDAETRVLRGHAGAVEAVALTPDLSALVSGSDHGGVRLWRLQTRHRVIRNFNLNSGRSFASVSISPNGDLIGAVTSDGEVSLFDFHTLELVHQIRARGAPPRTIAFSADSTILATLSSGEPLRLYAKEGPPREIPLPGGSQAGQIRFSPNGRLIAISGRAEVPLIDIHKRGIVRLLAHAEDTRDATTRDLVFVDDSRLLASCRNGSLYRWSVEDGRMTGKVPLQAGEIYDLAVSPDRRLAAVRGFREVKVVDLSEMNIVASLPSQSEEGGVSFLGGGRTLLIGEPKSQPTLWQTGTWQRVGQIEMPDVRATSASSDGLRLVTWRYNGLSAIDARVDSEQDRR